MATTGVGFRWLDILEKEFDKACVELNTSIAELEAEEPDVVVSARQKIATLSSCFAQLTHKALTIFQNSAKLEAELVDMRAELVQARAASAGALQEGGDAPGNVLEVARARSEAAQLGRENAALRETVLALHSELFGARLATKYLDKELAGRIQQLQLLGRDMRSELRDSLWAQVEAEILLQRHKTLVRVCRGLSPRAAPAPAPARERAPAGGVGGARPRTVRVRRSPHLGLGISVTGGREHGVPILISELEEGGPAAMTGELCVGDAILAINDVDLTQVCHKEAVQALQSVKGDCALCVQLVATDDDDRLSEDNYRFPLYPEDGEEFEREQDGSGATPTAPRTPDYNNRDECEEDSGSECRSPVRRYPGCRGVGNLAILDMDDDSIKIQASLEPDVEESPGGGGWARRGPYASLEQSSGSAASTPVHSRRGRGRPKLRSHNNRHYRALDTGNDDSSDEKQECELQSVPSPPEAACPPAPETPCPPAPEAPCPPAPEMPCPLPPEAPCPPPPEVPVESLINIHPDIAPVPAAPIKINGDGRRRDTKRPKGFRIGSARRVTEPPPLLMNGDVRRVHGKLPARAHPLPSHTPPSHPPPPHLPPSHPPPPHLPPSHPPPPHPPLMLLAGDGDPDFGTPV